jgi:hypothetical protein
MRGKHLEFHKEEMLHYHLPLKNYCIASFIADRDLSMGKMSMSLYHSMFNKCSLCSRRMSLELTLAAPSFAKIWRHQR